MLQEGIDYVVLKSMYGSNLIQVHYKVCDSTPYSSLQTKPSTRTVDDLPFTWAELLQQEPSILSAYQHVTENNNTLSPTFTVITYLKGSDKIQLVYTNDCVPCTTLLHTLEVETKW